MTSSIIDILYSLSFCGYKCHREKATVEGALLKTKDLTGECLPSEITNYFTEADS